MELIIRNTDSQPIYEQIAAQLRRQILSGALAPVSYQDILQKPKYCH